MCPQKWKAAASSASTAAATALPPTMPRTVTPTRPRNDRRVIPEARPVASDSPASPSSSSGRRTEPPRASCGNEPVQLLERVHEPLGGDDAVDQVDDERASGDVPGTEGLRLVALVDDADGEPFAVEGADPREEITANSTRRREERDELGAAAGEPRQRRRLLGELGALAGDLERALGRPEAEGQDADLAVEREDEDTERGDGERDAGEGEPEPRLGREGRRAEPRGSGREPRERRERDRPREDEVGRALAYAEATAAEPRHAGEAQAADCDDEDDPECDSCKRRPPRRHSGDEQGSETELGRDERRGGGLPQTLADPVRGQHVGEIAERAELRRSRDEKNDPDREAEGDVHRAQPTARPGERNLQEVPLPSGRGGDRLEEIQEDLDDGRIELRPCPVTDPPDRLFDRQSTPVRAVGRHGVERVANEDDARLDRDVPRRPPVRIAVPVEPFVTVADDRPDVREPNDGRENALAQLRVPLHDPPLLRCQRSGLQQDLGRGYRSSRCRGRAPLARAASAPSGRVRADPRPEGPCP